MEIGIYIFAYIIIISSVRAIFGRLCRLFLAAREVVATLFTEHHFPSVLQPLSGDVDVWRITCSLIALALSIHI